MIRIYVTAAFGDGCYAFEFAAKPAWLERHHIIEARVANSGEQLGKRDLALSPTSYDRRQAPIGAVAWDGGIRLSGWVRDDPNCEPGVRAFRR